MIKVLAVESKLLLRFNLPFGTTITVISKRKES